MSPGSGFLSNLNSSSQSSFNFESSFKDCVRISSSVITEKGIVVIFYHGLLMDMTTFLVTNLIFRTMHSGPIGIWGYMVRS